MFTNLKALEHFFLEVCQASLQKTPQGHTLFEEVRQRAWDAFKRQGLPTRKREDYRYTPLMDKWRAPFGQGLAMTSPTATTLRPPKSPWEHLAGHHSFWYNDLLMRGSAQQPLEAIQIMTLVEAYALYPDLLNRHWGQCATTNDPFVALNTVLAPAPMVLYVRAGLQLDKPIILHRHFAVDIPTAFSPRLLVVMGQGSAATLIETTAQGTATPAWVNSVTEVVLEKEASLDHYCLQAGDRASTLAYHLSHAQVVLSERSRYHHYHIACAGELHRMALGVQLAGQGSQTALSGLYSAGAQEHLGSHLRIAHIVPDTKSTTYYKGIASQQGSALFDGRIRVVPAAQRTVAAQHHHGCLLSQEAHIYSRPQLSIDADDVVCQHGSTTGQLDEQLLSYARTRGIPSQEAYRMLLAGFFEELLTQLPCAPIRDHVRSCLLDKVAWLTSTPHST